MTNMRIKIPGVFIAIISIMCAINLTYGSTYESPLKFNHINILNGLPHNSVYSITKDKYGFMWFGTWGGAVRYDGYTFRIFRTIENDTTSLDDNRIESLATDSLQNVWILTGSRKYVFRFNYELENFERYEISKISPEKRVNVKTLPGSASASKSNNIFRWEATKHGLIEINYKTGKSVIYLNDRDNPFSISDNDVRNIYLDDINLIWLGTQSGGVNVASLHKKPFHTFTSGETSNGLIENAVRAVCVDKSGRILVGSENQGITIIGKEKGKLSYDYLEKNKIRNPEIRALLCDKDGIIWIGTKDGLYTYNPDKKSLKEHTTNICNHGIYALHEDKYGVIWVGTLYKLAWYDRKNDQFVILDREITGGVQIRDIFEDSQDNLWIATEDAGITKLIRKLGNATAPTFTSIRYFHEKGNTNSIVSNRTFSIEEDKLGMIWIATNSGLSRLNPNDGIFTHFTENEEMPDNLFMGVIFDQHESVWVSHNRGLSRININTLEKKHFNTHDGLQAGVYSQSTCYRDSRTGLIYFGGTNGLNTFYPEQIETNPHPPKVVFTDLSVMHETVKPGKKINNRIILDKSITLSNKLTLSHRDKTFRISFSALHYTNPKANQYRYKLEGFDQKWISANAFSRSASYSNLAAGNYKLLVHASNSDGVWTLEPSTLIIQILPPWWLTWWAIVLYIAFASFIIWLIIHYFISRIKLKKEKEIHQAKLNFFTEVSHEFRTPLTLIIDPLEKMMHQKLSEETTVNYFGLMHRNANQLLHLVNQLLDFRKLESGRMAINIAQTDIVSLVRSTANSFDNQAKDRNIKFEIRSDSEHFEIQIDSEKIVMVINNLLSNAFKFTSPGGEVSIRIQTEDLPGNYIEINVEDNGNGIIKEDQKRIFEMFFQSGHKGNFQKGSGIGLALTKELIALHGGEIGVTSREGYGSCFTVRLPINCNDNNTQTYHKRMSDDNDRFTEQNKTQQITTKSESKPILLVVDDNADIRQYIRINFEQEFHIRVATNGKEGVEVAIECIPDLIISDVMMPEMDGFELCGLLKSDQRTSHIPVILLTASHSDSSKLQGFENGADAYVTKPFQSRVLMAQAHNLIGQRRRLRELFTNGSALELQKIAINNADQTFLTKITQYIEENMEEGDISMETLAEKLKMSRTQFYRKLKALTNQTYHDFVIIIRMRKAIEYLTEGEHNISEIAYKVGYSIPTNFTRAFSKQYGLTPTQYVDNLKSKY